MMLLLLYAFLVIYVDVLAPILIIKVLDGKIHKAHISFLMKRNL